jgi:hypothetical protein
VPVLLSFLRFRIKEIFDEAVFEKFKVFIAPFAGNAKAELDEAGNQIPVFDFEGARDTIGILAEKLCINLKPVNLPSSR